MAKVYNVKVVENDFDGYMNVDKSYFNDSEVANINNFRPEGSSHKPMVLAQIVGFNNGILGSFDVEDQYVICNRKKYNSKVCNDSCVEFFIKPKSNMGYFNFEFNCFGTIHCSYIVDPKRVRKGFKEYYKIPIKIGSAIKVNSSCKGLIPNEIDNPFKWELYYFIPFTIMENYIGKLDLSREWNGNFYKCADKSSHPHWGSWNPVSKLNFHAPNDFGIIKFKK